MRANKVIQNQEFPSAEQFSKDTEARLTQLEALASTHIGWYTHKNPYGCWICDLILLNWRTLQTFNTYAMISLEAFSEEESSMKQASLDFGESGKETPDKEIE